MDSKWSDILTRVPDTELANEGSAPLETLLVILDDLNAGSERDGFLYAVWEGFGFWVDAKSDNETSFTKFGPYHIFSSQYISFDPWPGSRSGHATEMANVIVPVSAAWAIVTPIDSFETYVSASKDMVTKIVTDARIEAVESFIDDAAGRPAL